MVRNRDLLRAAVIGVFAATVTSVHALSIDPFAGSVTIKSTAFFAENPGTVRAGGAPLFGSAGLETTWGAGYVTSMFETGNPLNTIWHSGKNSETLSFIIYGIADVAIVDHGGGDFTIYQTGCTVGAGCDGKIHIDFYRDSTGGTNPSFTANPLAPDAARASITDRTGFSTMNGITDGILEMRWELVPTPLTLADPLALITTLLQKTNPATAPASGNGNFYANCISGPLCVAFNAAVQTTGIGTTADLYGGFNRTPIPGNVNYPNAATNGWVLAIDDPVLAVTTGTVPPPPPPATPAEHVAAISASISSLVASGAITANDAKGLFAKLDAASKALAKNDSPAAANVLRALSNEVSALQNSQRISPSDAASLQQMIANAIASLS